MTTSLPWHPLLSPKSQRFHPSTNKRFVNSPNSLRVQAFQRSDFDGFAKRMASGEAWKDAWRNANNGFEQLLYETKKTAERIDRQYSVRQRFSSAAQSASDRARELDRDYLITQRWRTFSLDFSRNWPRYRKQIGDSLDTPLGRSFGGVFQENVTENISAKEDSEMVSWLESFERQDWILCVGGTSQEGMTSHIVVAAALVVWYPSLVKLSLAMLCIQPLLKLVMAMNEKYSSTAAEILAEGMESVWSVCFAEIPRLISDIFHQIEHGSVTSLEIRESLVEILLPSLAMADVPAFLHVIERQIWSTASDSPVHIVSRGSPRNLAPYLDKVVSFILQTMDPGNMAMRKSCLQNSMATLKEVVRVFPMVALNDSSSRLAVGDAIGDINKVIIRVYEMQSMTKVKILDASGPPGLRTLLGSATEMTVNTAISVLSFSPDGGGLIAFSEHGLMIRWWSLGSMWWEKISRNLVPVHCTKLIFVPPWEGFSPTSTRSSVMASVMGNWKQFSQDNSRDLSEMERLKLLLHNLDLSYRLEWDEGRKVLLKRHGQE